MSLRIDITELIAGALVIGDVGLGVRGDAIPPAGLHGASYLANDVDPGDEAREFRGLIVTPPAAGVFYAWEDGAFTLTGAPDGSYTFTYRLFVDGADLGTATATVLVGGVSGVIGSVTGLGLVSGYGAMTGTVSDPVPGSVTGYVAGTGLVVGGGAVSGGVSDPAPSGVTGSITGAGAVLGVGAVVGILAPLDEWPADTSAYLADASSCLPYVVDDIPAVPFTIALRALVDAARLFCQKSWAWQQQLASVPAETGRDLYQVPPVSGADLCGVVYAEYGGKQIGVLAEANAPVAARRFRGYSRPRAVVLERASAFRLVPAPQSAPEALDVWAALAPKRGGRNLPSFLVDQYALELGAGAKALLYRQTGAAWYSEAAAAMADKVFWPAVWRAKRDALTSFGGTEDRVQLQEWV